MNNIVNKDDTNQESKINYQQQQSSSSPSPSLSSASFASLSSTSTFSKSSPSENCFTTRESLKNHSLDQHTEEVRGGRSSRRKYQNKEKGEGEEHKEEVHYLSQVITTTMNNSIIASSSSSSSSSSTLSRTNNKHEESKNSNMNDYQNDSILNNEEEKEEGNDVLHHIHEDVQIILNERECEYQPSTMMFNEVSNNNFKRHRPFSILRRRLSGTNIFRQKEKKTSLLSSLPPKKGNDNNNNSISTNERSLIIKLQKRKEAEEELAKHALKRQMTTKQELWNAITMIPAPAYCLYFCLNGLWLTKDDTNQVLANDSTMDSSLLSSFSSSCIQSEIFPNLHTIPPLTILSYTIGVLLHSPCSIYYHLLCAYKLPPGPKRMDHWTRRLDQAMIHLMSSMFAYSTSASRDYFLLALAFNIDCMYRLFQSGMRPGRTLIRMMVAFLIPVVPFIYRTEWMVVCQLGVIYGISGWLFTAYPLGGWSHGAFHLVCCLSNPITIRGSLGLDVDVVKDCIDMAVRCSLIGKK